MACRCWWSAVCPGEAGTALSALWVGMMLSQPLMGWLLDRVAPRVALPFALAAVLGMAWFLVGDTERSMAGGVPGRPGRRRKAAPPSTC